MDDAWDVFVLSLDLTALELERYGPAPLAEAFTGPEHQRMMATHEFQLRRYGLRKAFTDQARRLELLREVHAPAPARHVVARVGQSLKPKAEPKRKYTPQEVFSARQYEIAMAALDAPKLKPIRYAA